MHQKFHVIDAPPAAEGIGERNFPGGRELGAVADAVPRARGIIAHDAREHGPGK